MADMYIARQGQPLRRQQQQVLVNGGVWIKDGKVFITKVTAAAVSLAAPIAGLDDGYELTIISTTAVAHTLTVSGGANGGGTATDVGTFGGAIGDGVVLTAFNGVWLVVNNTNVTFA